MEYLQNLWLRGVSAGQRLIFIVVIDNSIVRPFRLPLVTVLVPAVAASYITLAELYTDKWAIFYNYPDVHRTITIGIILATMAVALFRGISDSYIQTKGDGSIKRWQLLTTMSSEIVLKKTSRFCAAARAVTPGDDVFLKITQPDDQISVILSEAKHFLLTAFEINSEQQLRIGIMQFKDGEWRFIFDTQPGWNPERAITEKSLAQSVVSTGEPQFYHDKFLAAASGKYKKSSRDDRLGNGSIYCYPVRVQISGSTVTYVISLATYGGARLCGNHNRSEIQQIALLLKEICRRIELELTLRSLRHWKLGVSGDQEAQDV